MIILFTGYRKVDYENKTGRKISGATVYGVLQDSFDSSHIVGKPVFEQFVSGFNPDGLVEGAFYEVEIETSLFNGKPQARVVGFHEA